jgi:glucoamylase
MPLVWAHSEFIKLCYSLDLGYPVDRPTATWNRYGGERPAIRYEIWGPRYRPRHARAGHGLTVALSRPARVHWGVDDWKGTADLDTRDTGLGVHVVDLPIAGLAAGQRVVFTFYWLDEDKWEGADYAVELT